MLKRWLQWFSGRAQSLMVRALKTTGQLKKYTRPDPIWSISLSQLPRKRGRVKSPTISFCEYMGLCGPSAYKYRVKCFCFLYWKKPQSIIQFDQLLFDTDLSWNHKMKLEITSNRNDKNFQNLTIREWSQWCLFVGEYNEPLEPFEESILEKPLRKGSAGEIARIEQKMLVNCKQHLVILQTFKGQKSNSQRVKKHKTP